MAKFNSYYYLVDKLDTKTSDAIKKSLKIIPGIEDVRVDLFRGIVEVLSEKEMEEQVKMACDVSGALYRTKVKKKDLL